MQTEQKVAAICMLSQKGTQSYTVANRKSTNNRALKNYASNGTTNQKRRNGGQKL